jgi:SAM-dependent methyltransferase
MTEKIIAHLDQPPGRRVCRLHDAMLDGLTDLLMRARGASVLDVGCNRGLAAYAFACNEARICHGIDLAPDAIFVARSLFADLAECRSQFEVGDLTKGAECLAPFGDAGWDIVLMMGVYHKIKRAPSKEYKQLGAVGMSHEQLSEFMTHLGRKTIKYFAWRGDDVDCAQVDKDMQRAGLRLIHRTEISGDRGIRSGPSCIWRRD